MDRYIVGTNPTGDFANHINEYAQYTGVIWTFTKPLSDDIVYIINLGVNYIFTGKEWILPEFTIPLKLNLEVFRADSYYGSDIELSNLVKTTIINTFSERFGTNVSLYLSEIVACVQGITGVSHCNVVAPKSNIFFNFNLDSLTQQQLLEYAPEYIFFKEEDISITVI